MFPLPPLSPACWDHLPNKLPVPVCSSQVLLSEGFKLRHRPVFHKLLPRHLQCLHKLPVFWILGCPGLTPVCLPSIISPYLSSLFVPVKQGSRLFIFSSVILLNIQHLRKCKCILLVNEWMCLSSRVNPSRLFSLSSLSSDLSLTKFTKHHVIYHCMALFDFCFVFMYLIVLTAKMQIP